MTCVAPHPPALPRGGRPAPQEFHLVNKLPVWDEETKQWSLRFYGGCTPR